MRGFRLGASVLGLGLALGCGKTHADDAPSGVGGSPVAGEPSTSGGAPSGSGGATNAAGDATAATANGGTGGRMLPPDPPLSPAVALHKLDLLLMLDNSRSMLEKQQLLTEAVKWLLSPSSGLELAADDIHIGVVTSSLGSHGSSGANDVCTKPADDDHAHLLGSIRPNLHTSDANGFLAWGPAGGEPLDLVAKDLGAMMAAAGDKGCGYEASLEAWYRFLIDPTPPLSVVVPTDGSLAAPQGIDSMLLDQRAAFLRGDSVLSIVMLTDENDCSIVDEGYGWLVTHTDMRSFRSTSACSDPNDACCQSCAEAAANPGCPAISSDSECQKGIMLGVADDSLNLRCWDQKRRFGLDLLQPLSRYVDGLTRQSVFNVAGDVVQNPIFKGLSVHRHPSQVILTGIVGVPWQDLADQASLTGPGLTNLTAAELTKQGRWKVMIGEPNASPPIRATDPFMLEMTSDRALLSSVHENPISHDLIVPSDSTNPLANAINGHESVNVANAVLQPACTFAFATPRLCDQAAKDADSSCKCFSPNLPENSAICQPPGGGPAGTTQYGESATPSLRPLQVLQALGDNAVTSSICPKIVDPADADYGYHPAMKALATRLARAFNP
jgi:hypothetical protein